MLIKLWKLNSFQLDTNFQLLNLSSDQSDTLITKTSRDNLKAAVGDCSFLAPETQIYQLLKDTKSIVIIYFIQKTVPCLKHKNKIKFSKFYK